jgi:hypothetical protein
MKSINMNSNLIIILLIGLLIFLGVLWLYKNNKIREGIDPPDPDTLKEFAADSNDRMAAIGLSPPSTDELNNMLDTIGGIIDGEVSAVEARQAARAEADAATPAVNTVQPSFMPLTFFTGNKFGDAFCEIYGGNPLDLTSQCSTLTSESCNATNCCVWVNGKKCMAGNEKGPSVPMGSAATIDADYYSYKYQCYGNCNSPTIVPPSRTIPSAASAGAGAGAGAGPASSGQPTGECMTDDTTTNVTPECVNQAWSQLGCENTWKQIPMNKGWFNLPGSLLNVDTTNKNLYYKDKSTHVADITGQTMALVQGHMAAMAQHNPNACVPQSSVSNTDMALSTLFG